MAKTILVVRDEEGVIEEVPVDKVVSSLGKDKGITIVGWDDIYSPDVSYVYPGLIDLNPKDKTYILTFKRYMGTNKPRLYANCKLVERGVDYIIKNNSKEKMDHYLK